MFPVWRKWNTYIFRLSPLRVTLTLSEAKRKNLCILLKKCRDPSLRLQGITNYSDTICCSGAVPSAERRRWEHRRYRRSRHYNL